MLLLLLLACAGDKDTGDECYDLTEQTTCAQVNLNMIACCTDSATCLVGVRTDDGKKPGPDYICYDGIESAGCVNAVKNLESLWCEVDSGS